MPVFALGIIICHISYVFKDKKSDIKSTHLRMNPSSHSASWKKIHLFLQGLVEVHILLYLFFSQVSFFRFILFK
jgi:ABC-type uncharacterized transport system permease subunit